MGTRGDKFPVVYVDGDVPQLPIQLGQLLVDSSLISPGATNLQQCTSQDPLVYEGIQGFYGRTAAEITAGVTPTDYTIPDHTRCGFVNMRRYGWVSSTSVDQTTIRDNAYLVAKASGAPLQIPAGNTKFTSTFVIDNACGVIGESREDSIMLAAFTGLRIKIDIDGEQAEVRGFTLDNQSGTGNGIEVWNGGRLRMRDVIVYRQTINILLYGGNDGSYTDIKSWAATSDNFKIDSEGGYPGVSCWNCEFNNLDTNVGAGWGFNLEAGQSHKGNITAQSCTGGGVRINSNNNDLSIYAEANTTWDIFPESGVLGNTITVRNVDSSAKIAYRPGNIYNDGAIQRGIVVSTILAAPPVGNVAGNPLSDAAGDGGAGASPVAGGKRRVAGGAAGGTGNANGGAVELEGGAKLGTGGKGPITILNSNITHARTLAGGGYSASITPDARAGLMQAIRANNSTAFTINAPTNAIEGDELELQIYNVSGGALGALTLDAIYKLISGTPTQPATGFHRNIRFDYDGVVWSEQWRSAADLANA